jgi:hypothetical protein
MGSGADIYWLLHWLAGHRTQPPATQLRVHLGFSLALQRTGAVANRIYIYICIFVAEQTYHHAIWAIPAASTGNTQISPVTRPALLKCARDTQIPQPDMTVIIKRTIMTRETGR